MLYGWDTGERRHVADLAGGSHIVQNLTVHARRHQRNAQNQPKQV